MSAHFLVRPNTVEEEVDRLRHTFKKRDFYLKEDYVPQLPVGLELKSWTTFNENSIRESVIKEYDSEVYARCVKILDSRLKRVDPVFPILKKLNNLWGFKVYPKYTVKLTKYGVGGSYDLIGNSVRIRITSTGMFPKSPEQIVVHEIIHIGIEQILVREYDLNHSEKEYLVDLIMIHLLDDYLPGYKEVYSEQINMNRIEGFLDLIPYFSSKEFPNYVRGYKKG